MSYILDALKKNQAEQNPDAIAVSMADHTSPSRWNVTLLVVVAVLLILNAAFFAYQMFAPEPATSEPGVQPERSVAVPAKPPQTPTAQSEAQPEPPAVDASQASTKAQTEEPTMRALPRSKVIERVRVNELSQNEQLLYNGLNFTSHIYTDEPSECAIVVDGYRLQAGDGFKGLRVIEITEDGVVFAETRGNVERHVYISILERWASEG